MKNFNITLIGRRQKYTTVVVIKQQQQQQTINKGISKVNHSRWTTLMP